MATSFDKGQIISRVKGQTTCINHKGRPLELYCEQCKQLACTQCLSTEHRSHPMCVLPEIIPQHIQDIKAFINKTENVDLVQIGQLIASTETDIKDNASTKDDLDLITSQTMPLSQQTKEDNNKLLQTYKQHLENYDSQLKQQIQECTTVLQRGSNIEIYDAWCVIEDSQFTLPVKPTCGTAAFNPDRNPQRHLKLALGKMSISDEGEAECQGRVSPGHDRSAVASVDKMPTQQWSEPIGRTAERKEGYALLPQTKMVGECQSPCNIYSLCPTADGQLWTECGGTLTLLDRNGTVIQYVEHSAWVNGINISPNTNELWVCDDKNNIMELSSGRLVHRFSTSEMPRCICITAYNHIIVGMTKRISKYTTQGETVLTTAAGVGEQLVRSPYRISQCPVTNNIAVIDKNSEKDDGDGNQQVVVIDTYMYFKKLCVYGGELPSKYAPVPHLRKPFDPSDVAYDSVGNLVIGDSNNCCILLTSGHGEFLRVIHTDVDNTYVVGVDKEDVLWAVFGGDNVKRLQYSGVQ